MSLSVVCPLAYLSNYMTNFAEFSVHLDCGRGSVLLWCFDFLDDVMLVYNGLMARHKYS